MNASHISLSLLALLLAGCEPVTEQERFEQCMETPGHTEELCHHEATMRDCVEFGKCREFK